jgi:hypothetical protein
MTSNTLTNKIILSLNVCVLKKRSKQIYKKVKTVLDLFEEISRINILFLIHAKTFRNSVV